MLRPKFSGAESTAFGDGLILPFSTEALAVSPCCSCTAATLLREQSSSVFSCACKYRGTWVWKPETCSVSVRCFIHRDAKTDGF